MGLFGYLVFIASGFWIACVSCYVPGLDGVERRRGFMNYAVPRGPVQVDPGRGSGVHNLLPRPAVTLYDFGAYGPAASSPTHDHSSHGHNHGATFRNRSARSRHDHGAHDQSHARLTQYSHENGQSNGALNIDHSTHDHSTHDHSTHDHSAHGHSHGTQTQDYKANGPIESAPIHDHRTHDHSAHGHSQSAQTQDYNAKGPIHSAPRHDHSAHDYSAHNQSAHRHNHDTLRHDHSKHDPSKHDHSTHDHSTHDHSTHDHSTHDHSTHDHSTHDHGSHSQKDGMPGTRTNIIDFSLYPQSNRSGGSGGRSGGVRGQGRGRRIPSSQGRGNFRRTNPMSGAMSRRLRGGRGQRGDGGNNRGLSNNYDITGDRWSQVRGRLGQARMSQGRRGGQGRRSEGRQGGQGRRSQGRRGGQDRGQGQVGYSENQRSSQMACPIGVPYPGRRCIGFMGVSCPYGYMCWRNPLSQVPFGYCCSMGFSPFQVF